MTVARRSGWIKVGDKLAFALPSEIIGDGSGERIILAREVAAASYSQAGTLEDVANPYRHAGRRSSHVALHYLDGACGTAAVFGRFRSGFAHLYGQSSEGKTTCSRVAASAWGPGGDGGYPRTWRVTANGLEATLVAFNDTLLVLDELGQISATEVRQVVYMITGSLGKARMRRDASSKPSHEWRVMALSSGETPIEAKLGEDHRRGGGRAHAGQLVRAIDIPARRALGVFDLADIEFNPKAFADQMKRASLTYYGTAGPAFVRALIERSISDGELHPRVDAFVARALEGTRDYHGQAARVAERFGLIATAGELAIEVGIVPWKHGVPTEDGIELFAGWLETRGGAGPAETRHIIAQVRHFLEAHGESRFDDVTTPDPDRRPVINRAGFRKGHDAGRRWFVLPTVWGKEICAGHNPTKVAEVLASAGMLIPGRDGKYARLVRIGSGTPLRVYVITPAIFESGEADAEGDAQDDGGEDAF